MKLRHRETWARGLKLLNALMVTASFAICWYVAYADTIKTPFYRRGNWVLVALFFVVYVTYGKIYEAFKISFFRRSEMICSQLLSLVLTNAMMYIVIWLINHIPVSPIPMGINLLVQLMLCIIWCFMSQKWYFSKYRAKNTVILYDLREGIEDLICQSELAQKFHIVHSLHVQEALDNNLAVLTNAEVVFLAGVHSHERNIVLKKCVSQNIQAYVIPRIGDVLMSGAQRVHMFHLPILRIERYNPAPEFLIAKRLFDIVSSGLVLLLCLPLMIVVAIIIKATDNGPVFYKQTRMTKDGKLFQVIKFRSMRVDAEKDGIARLSTGATDDRVTPIGRFIRKVRIDELPQLINILKGDMSVVGPRPERPEIAAEYEKQLPEFALRLQAKAGLTGYAQIYGKYNTIPYDKLQMDLMYIANPSIIEDFRIIFATIKVLFQPESTEGISTDNIHAMQTK